MANNNSNSHAGGSRGTRIIFLGTPDFAVASLDALVQAGFNIVGVVTAPDKPGGRGMKMQESPVKKYALEKGLIILQPEKLKNLDFLEQLKSFQADLQVVVAFRMLPEAVWNMPPMGTINLHASLLPQYRGAAPINWAIINGEKETGVTTFKLKQEIDTGDILLQERTRIGDKETAGELHDRLKIIGAELLVKTAHGLESGKINEIPQSEIRNSRLKGEVGEVEFEPIRHAPKIYTETCKIDWTKSTEEIYNLIRGLSPYPGAFTFFQGKMLKVFRTEKELIIPKIPSGEFETDEKAYLKFACNNGYLYVTELQLEGKKKLQIEEFLRGYRPS